MGPGVQYGAGPMAMANRFGQLITVVLAVCCLPHVTMRVLGAPADRATRTAMRWAVGQLVAISALLLIIGLGTATILGGPALSRADPAGSISLLPVTQMLSPGGVLVSTIFRAAVLTALTTVAEAMLAAATSVARDLLPRRPRPGTESVQRQDRPARCAAAVVGAVTVTLAVPAAGWNLLVLPTLAITLAASALAYTFLWRGFTRRGLL